MLKFLKIFLPPLAFNIHLSKTFLFINLTLGQGCTIPRLSKNSFSLKLFPNILSNILGRSQKGSLLIVRLSLKIGDKEDIGC
jgi:hypothetical protein